MCAKQEQYLKERINIPGRKTIDEVFDKRTLSLLYRLMTKDVIDILDYPISTGKEAKVFKALDREGRKLAVKIMRTSTAPFKEYRRYIEGDHRFKNIGSGKQLVFTWTKKEFSNLKKMYEKDVTVPRPVHCTKNILIMELVEFEGYPAPMLRDYIFAKEEAEDIMEHVMDDMYKLMNDAELVHGDLSEYNILMSDDGVPYIIDVSQAVPSDHPIADELIDRDIKNIVKYFNGLGLDIDKDEVKERLEIA
ncbi:MAG: serine protein kinase RIO [Thermoplasmata archaeon]